MLNTISNAVPLRCKEMLKDLEEFSTHSTTTYEKDRLEAS